MSFSVGSGAAEPVESVVELAPLMSALFDGAEPLFEREALHALHALPEQRYWLLQDIQALLERVALKQPLLVCLDDLQWADSGTAAALRALPARLAALPIAWMIAFRPDQRSTQLMGALEYLEREGAEKIVLGPLDEAAVAQVAVDVMQAEPDAALLELLKRAHGSPFMVIELLSGLRDEELVRVDSGQAELVEDRLPRRVGDSMRERLRGMSEPARGAAIVAGSLGRRISFRDLATMLDQPPSALLSPIEELMTFGVVIERDEELAFRHDIIRDAVRASLPVSARRALDGQAADVLLAAGATPVEVATQLAASAEPGDERAITTLFKAAEVVAMSDPGGAADLSRRAPLSSRRAGIPCGGHSRLRPRCCCTRQRASRRRGHSSTRLCVRRFHPSQRQRSGSVSRGCSPFRPTCVSTQAGRRSHCPTSRPPCALDTSRASSTISWWGAAQRRRMRIWRRPGRRSPTAVMRTPHSCSISPRADWRRSPDGTRARSS
jgi:hypothetical protein